jgi:alkylation response protein AidB-like acyl-CoA dehydrogenase
MTSITTPVTGNLLYTEIEDDLRASVRALLEKRAPWDAVLRRTESDETTDRQLWAQLAGDVGCAALQVPEEFGGAGVGWREVAVVAEELGRAVAPVPFLGHTIATALLLELDATGEAELIGTLAAAEKTAAVAVAFGTLPGAPSGAIEVHDGALYGSVRNVADAAIADVLLVPVGEALYAVDADTDGLERTEIVSLDMTRPLVDLRLDAVPARLLATGPHVTAAVAAALRLGVVVLASEQLGVMERSFEMTLEYLRIRRQFGRILGSYQGLKHRLADLWVLISQARAAARYAAECAATDSPDLAVAASLAKAHCSVVVQQAAEECIQMHGGIGFTWEHPAHLYLKRAKSSSIGLGTAERHRGLLAGLVDLPGVAAQ